MAIKKSLQKLVNAKSEEEAVIKIGYGDLYDLDVRLLWFRERINRNRVRQVLALVPSYGRFRGKKVGKELEALIDNHFVDFVYFGREYSPVLYLHLTITEDQSKAREIVEQVMRDRGAQEVQDDGLNSIRVWWD